MSDYGWKADVDLLPDLDPVAGWLKSTKPKTFDKQRQPMKKRPHTLVNRFAVSCSQVVKPFPCWNMAHVACGLEKVNSLSFVFGPKLLAMDFKS